MREIRGGNFSFITPPLTPPSLQAKGWGIRGNIFEHKTIAYVCVFALRCRFKMIFDFLYDEEYQEERGAKRHLGTLGAEKLKFTKKN